MTTAEKLAALTHYAGKVQDVETYEAVHWFRAFSQRCAIMTEWEKTVTALEAAPLEALPAQIVRESRKQLEALQATVKRTIEEEFSHGG
jgi:hypothetical protein